MSQFLLHFQGSFCFLKGIGAVIDWSMSGHIIQQYGWKYAFYVVALIFGIFSILLLTFVYDSPTSHPRIKEEEKEFILKRLNTTISNKKVIFFLSIRSEHDYDRFQKFCSLGLHLDQF